MDAASDPAAVKQDGSRFIITYDAYLGEHDDDAIKTVEKYVLRSSDRSSILFVQGDGFTGFHRSQVSKHAQAIGRMKHKLVGVAIANASGAVRFAIASVAMLVRVPLKGFDSVNDEIGRAHV